MFGRRPPPPPCPACAAKDAHIASLEKQLALVSERLYFSHGIAEYAPAKMPAMFGEEPEEEEPLSQTITNAIAFVMQQIGEGRDSQIWLEVEAKVRLLLAEGVSEDEIVRRIRKSDWEGVESADQNAEAMR